MQEESQNLNRLRADATDGCVEAALILAYIYKRGVGVEVSEDEARKWLRMAMAINPSAVVEWYFQHRTDF